ncbi:MAG TPA: DUF1365 domain-containing protein [Usitatibacter sp.]|nr:DUF1365 domain-containing protein [Usitatibacter sp.]
MTKAAAAPMQSALYVGRVLHKRLEPAPHAFAYSLFMAYLDLSELDRVFRDRWLWSAQRPALAWLRRSDYLGDPALPLDESVRALVHRETGHRLAGPVRMLAHLRMFGHCFNPVSFYYCFDPSGARVEAIVAEITNTPWNERHAYVLPADGAARDGRLHWRFGKAFHVSPFMPMEMEYDWSFTTPGEWLAVHMANRRGGRRVFDATLALRRREISGASLAAALARYPFLTANIVRAIYWQALRLRLKGAPFHPHPASHSQEVAP